LLAAWAPADASKVYLDGTSYQLRRGVTEGDADLITPWSPQWTGGPYCFAMAAQIGVRVVADPGENIRRWKLTGACLYSVPFGAYWTLPEGPWKEPGQTYWLDYLPPWIDVVVLEGDVQIQMGLPPPPPGDDGAGAGSALETDSFGKSGTIYVVQDAPKAPMSPAWAPVVNYSCFWAAGEYTSDGANAALTDALYTHGTYNGGGIAGYTSAETDSGETFHAKLFLADAGRPWGQCNDFADFLVCLSTSVGASAMKAQRTNPFTLPDPPFGPYPHFRYHALKPAGLSFWYEADRAYHPFGLLSSSVRDGCIFIQGSGIAENWPRDSTCCSRLVKSYDPPGTWSPTPGGGFAPAVTTEPLP